MAVETVILNLAYVALLVSTFTRTLTRLRLLLVAAGIGFVVFGLIVDNMSMVVWNIVTSGLHTYRVIKDEAAKRSVQLSPEEALLHRELFPDLSAFDFNLLWRLGRPVEYVDELMIVLGETPDFVALILDGYAEIWERDERIRVLRRGALLGEMSFASGHPATVDVRSRGRLIVHEWTQQDLRSLDHLRPAAANAVRDYVSGALAAKARL